MDDADRAQEINDRYLLMSLDALKKKQRMPITLLGIQIECEDCGAYIPEARRTAMPGCRRCIDCQTLLEHWRPL